MAVQSDSIVQSIRALSAALGNAQPDAELVEQFALHDDEAAFESLLKRHGPMIMRLCRRMSPTEQDAEDVFQATFFVLARKANSLRKAGSVGPWLFGVAYRIAMKSRSSRFRRERAGSLLETAKCDDLLERLSVREAEKLLLEELAKLSPKYRDPLMLCYLEGKTRDEAAGALKCALGTLKDRLQHGKELLQSRLKRRGVTLSATMLAGLFSESLAPVTLRAELVNSTLCAATVPAAKVAGSVARLASAGSTTGRMKLAFGMIAATVLVGFAASVASLVSAAQPGKEKAKEVAIQPAADRVEAKDRRVDSLGDPLPVGAVMRLGTLRHRVSSWQSMPDGKSYLSVRSGDVRRIDSKTGEVLESWSAPERLEIVGVAGNGRFMLATNHFVFYSGLRVPGQDEPKQEWQLMLYDLTKRKEAWSVREQRSDTDWPEIRSWCLAASGKWLATTGNHWKGDLRLWDAEKGTQLWRHQVEGQSLSMLGFADGDKFVVARGNNDGLVHILDRETGKSVRSFETAPINDYYAGGRLTPDGKHILLSGWNNNPRIWDLAGKELPSMEAHQSQAPHLAFSPDGKKLYSGGNTNYVLERAWPSGKPLRTIALGRTGIGSLAVSGDGKRLEVKFWGERALAFYDLGTEKRIPEPIDGHRGSVYGIGCAPNGSLVTFACDATVRTWDLKEGTSAAQIKVNLDLNAGSFALSADGKRVAVPKSDIDGILIYELATGKLLLTIPADNWSMKKLSFSPDGRFLSAIDTDRGIAQVWDSDSGKQVLKVSATQVSWGSTAGAFSPDSRIFAFTDIDQIRFWNTATWKEEGGIHVHANFGIAFSPDGRMLATTAISGVRVFEVATGKERLHVSPDGGYPTSSLVFSNRGRYLGWVNDRSKAFVLDVRTGDIMGPFAGHDDSISGITFTIDEKKLATSSADSTVLVWDIAKVAAKKSTRVADSDAAWHLLASDNAKVAFAAIENMAADPDKAIKRIADRVKPAEPLDKDWVAARLRDLDDAKFAQRDKATSELEQAGERVVPFLDKFLQSKPSVEARERAERLLAKLRGPTDEKGRAMQTRRGLEVLEWIGSDSARELVEILAKGAEGSSLTKEAKAALERWRR